MKHKRFKSKKEVKNIDSLNIMDYTKKIDQNI